MEKLKFFKMSNTFKITVRQRKITRKRVFAKYVTSCLATSDESISRENEQCPQVLKDTSTVTMVTTSPPLGVITSGKAGKPKFIKSTKRLGDCQLNTAIANSRWSCCGTTYNEVLEIHKHVAKEHHEEIERLTESRLNTALNDVCEDDKNERISSDLKQKRPTTEDHKILYRNIDTLPWLPSEKECGDTSDVDNEGQILLYYKYVDVKEPYEICAWQQELCRRLRLTGKIRIAREGINGTVGGSISATRLYMQSVQNHPVFQQTDFKTSKGSAEDFPNGLQVGVHSEIVPMGVDPDKLTYTQAGNHLSSEAFHSELESHLSKNTSDEKDTVFVDCRNFYESRIGQFPGALAPDIRKFSYWPEYIDKNVDAFRDKRVIMYCTGGIRCERGSAYLKSKGVCKDVLQLEGGIHRYMDKYPNGLFKGKLFVFDDRYAIATNETTISTCFYCSQPWDKYQPCSSPHCHQLVLSCPQCRGQGSTACCHSCKEIAERVEVEGQRPKEECECTRERVRIPQETICGDKLQQGIRTCIENVTTRDKLQHDEETSSTDQ
ncbi:thiosulfate sulfurtransferase/rhodanese-like domain-containing protein 2 [Amphiura filiformis]|uniref:thiosulfate sulfurtransferase/rhodanese-like domain-containing protein 2 n=1 Tax=Amphiura filiformis TaxID=82378 RepID=UPI003B22819A